MQQRLGTVPHTEPINTKGISSKMPYQAAITQRCPTRNQNQGTACTAPSTCTVHVNLPHPVNDPASITVLDRPPIAPTGCMLLGARVHYASYMRKALANAYVSPTLKLSLEGYLCTSPLLASAPNLRMQCHFSSG